MDWGFELTMTMWSQRAPKAACDVSVGALKFRNILSLDAIVSMVGGAEVCTWRIGRATQSAEMEQRQAIKLLPYYRFELNSLLSSCRRVCTREGELRGASSLHLAPRQTEKFRAVHKVVAVPPHVFYGNVSHFLITCLSFSTTQVHAMGIETL